MLVQWCGRDDRGLKTAAMELCERSGMKSNRMRAFLAQGVARLAVAREGTRLLGFATVMLRPAEHFARVDYMATAPESRRTGVATAVLEFVRDETQRSFDDPGARYDMVLVETPPDQVGFFGRRGARRIAGVDYQFPSEPPSPAALLAIPVRPGGELPRPYLEAVLRALYQIEGRAPGDPLLARMIAGLPARAALEAPRERRVPAEREVTVGKRRYRLRACRPADVPAVREHDLEAALMEAAGLSEAQRDAFREAWLSGRQGELEHAADGRGAEHGSTLLVLVDESERYAGHVWWETSSDPISSEALLWVQSIAVAREQRRRGCGGALLEEAFAEARALGLKSVALSVSAANAAGRALYEKKGFHAVRITMECDVEPM